MNVDPVTNANPAYPISSLNSSELGERMPASCFSPPDSASTTAKSASGSSTPPPRLGRRYKRASWACRYCAQRRVRCDAFAAVPCRRCREDDVCCIEPQQKAPRKKLAVQSPGSGNASPANDHRWPVQDACFTNKVHSMKAISVKASKDSFPASRQAQPDLNPALYIQPLRDTLAYDEIVYLQRKGAVTLPETNLQKALLFAYTRFVHPSLPVLDLHEFFTSLHSPQEGKGTISIFLYKAVLFAASAFVDESHSTQRGISCRQEVARKLFQDARLLYEFGTETNTVALIQGLLLMTLRIDPDDEPKDAWYWNGIALSLIEKLLLPTDIFAEPRAVSYNNGLRKRLWYCCYIRDQHIAMSLHRSLRLKERPEHVSDLREDDFCIKHLPKNVRFIHRGLQHLTVEVQGQMARIFIQRTRLSHLTGRALDARYKMRWRQTDGKLDPNNTNNNMVLAPRDQSDFTASYLEMNLQLYELREHLLKSGFIPSPQPDEKIQDISVLNLQRHYLHLFVEMTALIINEPEILALASQQEAAAGRVQGSCRRILEKVASLYCVGVVNLLPLETLTALQPALVHHLSKKTETSASNASASEVQILQCIQVLDTLGQIYGGVARNTLDCIDALYHSPRPSNTDDASPNDPGESTQPA